MWCRGAGSNRRHRVFQTRMGGSTGVSRGRWRVQKARLQSTGVSQSPAGLDQRLDQIAINTGGAAQDLSRPMVAREAVSIDPR